MKTNISKSLQEKLDNIPRRPGIYIFKDSAGKIIYIGKAKILRHRVRSYFQESREEGPKFYRLVSRIRDLETIITDSEVEALILEANLIKENRPHYNINLKDDKSYPVIRVTNEPFPRIFPTRRQVRDGSRYFGPYTDVHAMRELLKTIRSIFPIRSCNYQLDQENIQRKKFKVCLDYHIKRCEGPCEGLVGQKEYNDMIENVVAFIEGRDQSLIEKLKAQMYDMSQLLRFEEAARLRDQVKKIEIFQQRQKVVDPESKDRDIIAVANADGDACAVVFKVRYGKIIGRQHFYLDNKTEEPDAVVVDAFIKQFYLVTDFIPEEILLPCHLEDMVFIQQWLGEQRNGPINIFHPEQGIDARLVQMGQKNAGLLLTELQLQRAQADEYIHFSVQKLQQALQLPVPPRRIEAFDISNIQGADPVASMVCFINGAPHKSEYRHFKIRSKTTPDDFTMMREAVTRRYKRVLAENLDKPDLILIDGGKGQLNAALAALQEVGYTDAIVIALAKRLDEVFLPNLSDAQNLPKGSSALRLLQRVRDESHRFAVTYHRQLRQKRTIVSELEKINGIGPERRKALLQEFGSVRNIKQATIDEIAAVPGITNKQARLVWEYFHQKNASDGW